MKNILLVVLLFTVLTISAFQISRSRNFQFFGDLVSSVQTDKRIIALTFDDGPWADKYTNEVINVLDELDVKGTFFLNGKDIEKKFSSAQRLVKAGHDIGNHSYSHKRMVLMGIGEVKREVDTTSKLIRDIGYTGEIYFRPPHGKKLFTLPYYLKREGITYRHVMVSPEAIADHVVSNAKSGSIILLHVLGSNNQISRDAIPLIVNALKEDGFQFITLSNLLAERK